MRQAIMDYILLSPQERKRLHILMLPRKCASALERSQLKGGYSVTAYAGQHQRKVDNENLIKVRLLINNIVSSSMVAWTQQFSQFSFV
jgi:dynein heavy chain